MLEEQFNMPKPPGEPNELLETQNKEKKKLQKKARKWKVLTILTGIVAIVAVVILVVLYIDLQDSKYYWQDRYYDYKQDMQSLEKQCTEIEKQWNTIKNCGYIGENYAIEITDIGNAQEGVIIDRDMIAENMYYMTVKFTVYLIDENATWETPLYIDIINSDGSIPTDEEKDGHTSKRDLSDTTGRSTESWIGWGRDTVGSLDPGVYVFVFYEGDKIIQRQEVILK